MDLIGRNDEAGLNRYCE